MSELRYFQICSNYGQKVTVRFETLHCRKHILFTLKKETFWGIELSGNSLAIHWWFAFWSKQHCLGSARTPEPVGLCFDRLQHDL